MYISLKNIIRNDVNWNYTFFCFLLYNSNLFNSIPSSNLLIFFSLPRIISFIWFCENLLSICFNSFFLSERFRDFNPAEAWSPGDVPWRCPEGLLKVLTSRTYMGPSEDSQGANTKTDDLLKELFFRNNCFYIAYLCLFFTGRENIQKF